MESNLTSDRHIEILESVDNQKQELTSQTIEPQIRPVKKSKNYLIIIAGVILFISSVAGAYYAGTQQANNASNKNPMPVISNQAIPTESPTPTTKSSIDITSWKTFRNSENNYSFKHPTEIEPLERTDDSVQLQYKEILQSNAPDGYEQHPGYTMNFYKIELNGKNFKEVVEQEFKRLEKLDVITSPLTEIDINGNPGYTYSVSAGSIGVHYIIAPVNSYYIDIVASQNSKNKDYSEEIKAILSTFGYSN